RDVPMEVERPLRDARLRIDPEVEVQAFVDVAHADDLVHPRACKEAALLIMSTRWLAKLSDERRRRRSSSPPDIPTRADPRLGGQRAGARASVHRGPSRHPDVREEARPLADFDPARQQPSPSRPERRPRGGAPRPPGPRPWVCPDLSRFHREPGGAPDDDRATAPRRRTAR